MKDTLSVIIPNYNKGKYIEKCIRSVLGQSLQPDEIIVVDDCSTDDSLQTVTAIAEQNELVKVIPLRTNKGVSHARNIGLKAAQSQFVTFLDSDDYYENQDKLKNEMNLIREKGEDIIAYSKLVLVKEDSSPYSNTTFSDKEYPTNNIFGKMLTGRFKFEVCPRDYCVKRHILLEAEGYNERRDLYEDLELIIKLSQKHFFFCTYEYGTAHRQVADGLSQRDIKSHAEAREEIFREFTDKLPTYRKILYNILWAGGKLKKKGSEFFWKCADRAIDGLHLRKKH